MSFPFKTLLEFSEILQKSSKLDSSSYDLASARNAQLTKPAGALGRLEDLALWYAGWRGQERPNLERPQVIIFAGNHGVTSQGVSVFPTEVTAQMVINFEAGGAAINQLTDCFGASLDVHALQLELPTLDFTKGAAMSEADCVSALYSGWSSVDEKTDLLVAGEMGIGNTTSAAAVALALFGGSGTDWAGKGTGLDVEGVALKARIVEAGLAANPSAEGNGSNPFFAKFDVKVEPQHQQAYATAFAKMMRSAAKDVALRSYGNNLAGFGNDKFTNSVYVGAETLTQLAQIQQAQTLARPATAAAAHFVSQMLT